MSESNPLHSKTYEKAYLSKYRFLTAKVPSPDFIPDVNASTARGVEYNKPYERITDAIRYQAQPDLGAGIVYDFCVLGQDFLFSDLARDLLMVTLRINIILVTGPSTISNFLFNFRVHVTYGLPMAEPVTGYDDIYVNPVDIPLLLTEPMQQHICDVPIGMASRTEGDVLVGTVNVTIPRLRYTNNRERFRLYIVPQPPYTLVTQQVGILFATSVHFATSFH